MSRKRKAEAWAVVDTDGSFLAGPLNSRIAVEKQAAYFWGPGLRATRFVPHSASADAVVRAAVKVATLAEKGRSWSLTFAEEDLGFKVERYLKSKKGRRPPR